MVEFPTVSLPLYIFWLVVTSIIAGWLFHAYLKTRHSIIKYLAWYFVFKVPALGLIMMPGLFGYYPQFIEKHLGLLESLFICSIVLMNAICIFCILMLVHFLTSKHKRLFLFLGILFLIPFSFRPLFYSLSFSLVSGKILISGAPIWLDLLIPHIFTMVFLGAYFFWQGIKMEDNILKTRSILIGIGLATSGIAGPMNLAPISIVPTLGIKYISLLLSNAGHVLILTGVLFKLIASWAPFRYKKPEYFKEKVERIEKGGVSI